MSINDIETFWKFQEDVWQYTLASSSSSPRLFTPDFAPPESKSGLPVCTVHEWQVCCGGDEALEALHKARVPLPHHEHERDLVARALRHTNPRYGVIATTAVYDRGVLFIAYGFYPAHDLVTKEVKVLTAEGQLSDGSAQLRDSTPSLHQLKLDWIPELLG